MSELRSGREGPYDLIITLAFQSGNIYRTNLVLNPSKFLPPITAHLNGPHRPTCCAQRTDVYRIDRLEATVLFLSHLGVTSDLRT